jgi:hypothetical protein
MIDASAQNDTIGITKSRLEARNGRRMVIVWMCGESSGRKTSSFASRYYVSMSWSIGGHVVIWYTAVAAMSWSIASAFPPGKAVWPG